MTRWDFCGEIMQKSNERIRGNTMQKVVIITGGSRGIGAATAKLASQKGFAVCVNYRSNKQAAEQICNTIRANGSIAEAVQADISLECDVLRLFKEAKQKLGRINAVVNNAGIITPQSKLVDMDDLYFV